MKKKLTVIIICLLALFALFIYLTPFLKNDDTPKYVQYDMDASDSNHYKVGEIINVDDASFKMHGFELINSEELRKYQLDLDISSSDYEILQSNYTFMLAKDNNLWKKSNCIYEGDSITVVEIERNPTDTPNQIVIIDNKSFKILSTIDFE